MTQDKATPRPWRERLPPWFGLYVGPNTDVGIWCRSPHCKREKMCEDPAFCTQLVYTLQLGMEVQRKRAALAKARNSTTGEPK